MSNVVWFGTAEDFNMYLEESSAIITLSKSSPSFYASYCKAVSYERLPLELQYEIVEVETRVGS